MYDTRLYLPVRWQLNQIIPDYTDIPCNVVNIHVAHNDNKLRKDLSLPTYTKLNIFKVITLRPHFNFGNNIKQKEVKLNLPLFIRSIWDASFKHYLQYTCLSNYMGTCLMQRLFDLSFSSFNFFNFNWLKVTNHFQEKYCFKKETYILRTLIFVK